MAGPSLDFIRQLRNIGVIDAEFCRSRVTKVHFAQGSGSAEMQAMLATVDPKALARIDMLQHQEQVKRDKADQEWAEMAPDWSSR